MTKNASFRTSIIPDGFGIEHNKVALDKWSLLSTKMTQDANAPKEGDMTLLERTTLSFNPLRLL